MRFGKLLVGALRHPFLIRCAGVEEPTRLVIILHHRGKVSVCDGCPGEQSWDAC